MSHEPLLNDFGVTALGSFGGCTVQALAALDGSNRSLLSIEAAQGWSFTFELAELEDAERLLAFVREHTGRVAFAECMLGTFWGAPVNLFKDNESGDRFWLRASQDGQLVEFVLSGGDLVAFT